MSSNTGLAFFVICKTMKHHREPEIWIVYSVQSAVPIQPNFGQILECVYY